VPKVKKNLDLFHALKPVFENIAMAKVSTSGEEARELGYLRRADLVAMNQDRLVADAKQTALGLVRSEWRQDRPRTERAVHPRVLGEEFTAAAKLAVYMMLRGELYRNTMHWLRASWPTSSPARVKRFPIGQRAIRPRPRTRSLRLPLRRTQTQERIRAYPEDGQASAELNVVQLFARYACGAQDIWVLVGQALMPVRLC